MDEEEPMELRQDNPEQQDAITVQTSPSAGVQKYVMLHQHLQFQSKNSFTC